jgi:hypothetical protein
MMAEVTEADAADVVLVREVVVVAETDAAADVVLVREVVVVAEADVVAVPEVVVVAEADPAAAVDTGAAADKVIRVAEADATAVDTGAAAEIVTAGTDAVELKERKKYSRKRVAFAVPEGFVLVQVADILKPKGGLSKVWEHFDTFAKTSDASIDYVSMCKICGSSVRNTPIRSPPLSQHLDAKKTDYAHSLATRLCRTGSGPGQPMSTYITKPKPDQLTKLVEWMSESLVAPNAVDNGPWIEYNKSLDPEFRKQSRDNIYKELNRQVSNTKKLIMESIAEERKSGRKHFHFETDMWDEGYTKKHFIAILMTYINRDFTFQTVCLAFRLWEGSAENKKITEWQSAVFKEYGLDSEDARTNTTDAGSNMKKVTLFKTFTF